MSFKQFIETHTRQDKRGGEVNPTEGKETQRPTWLNFDLTHTTGNVDRNNIQWNPQLEQWERKQMRQ